MRISIVVAMSENRAIGKDNQLLWHLPVDLQHFKQITLGKPVLMGRKTHQSIGRPLPGRMNVVITHDLNFKSEGCVIVHSIQDALDVVQDADEICVIGGADLYRQMLPLSDRIYLTRVHHTFSADTFFPELNSDEWNEVECFLHPADEKNPYACEMVVLDRRIVAAEMNLA
ncbi:MAG TPA: dihydrofolate reductase [Gammaproteobacteria bacterium]|nr:dihydrofolate reductase [Gammaproteobacteria bacterium]